MRVVAIIPKNTLSGGSLELFRLVEDLRAEGCDTHTLSLFESDTNAVYGLIFAPFFFLSLVSKLIELQPELLILTHYSTLPTFFVKYFVGCKVSIFIQDFEWLFASSNPIIIKILKKFVLYFSALSDFLIFGNTYLLNGFPLSKVSPVKSKAIVYPVGLGLVKSAACNEYKSNNSRRFKLGFILRNGWLKNEHLYYLVSRQMLQNNCCQHDDIAAINMLGDSVNSNKYLDLGINISLPLPKKNLFLWYSDLDIFLCLSKHEGFGLPPLEAMSAGAIPLILHNGGCMNFMEPFPELVLQSESKLDDIFDRINQILNLDDFTRFDLMKRLCKHSADYFNYAELTRTSAILDLVEQLQGSSNC
jgi:glycosyltransferase involved in cell wall biosynthesis